MFVIFCVENNYLQHLKNNLNAKYFCSLKAFFEYISLQNKAECVEV